jgi:hypothetical protein
VKKVLTAAAAAVVLVVPAADAAEPKMTKAQAVKATKKFVKKDPRLTPRTVACTRADRTGFKCKATAAISGGGTCTVGVVVMLRNGKPWATGDKFTSREPGSCAQELARS